MDDLTGANDFPEELQKLFFETPMLLFEVYYFKNIHLVPDRFTTGLWIFAKNEVTKPALREYVKANEEVFSKLEEDTFDLLTVMSGIRAMKLIKRDVETVGGEFDMCKAFDDMMRDSKQEGIREGRREGERKTEERMNELIQKLVSAGRINDLLQASNNKKVSKKTDGGVGNCIRVKLGGSL